MKKSTLARIMLIGYGLDFVGLTLSIFGGHYVYSSLFGLYIGIMTNWFERNYFDKEEK